MNIGSIPTRQHVPQIAPIDTSESPAPDTPSLAYYPALKQQVENLKYLACWDDTTSTLVKSVAGKLHSDQKTLSPHWDNDSFLGELEAFNGRGDCRDTPAYLREFFQKVAAELESTPDYYQSLLPCQSAGTVAVSTQAQDGGSAVGRMLYAMAWNVIDNVAGKLCIEAIPIPRLRVFTDVCEELRSIYQGNYSPQRKLEDMSAALEHLGQTLTAHPDRYSQAYKTLKGYLDAVTPWLKSVSSQWRALETNIHDLNDQQSVLGKVVGLMAISETLLSDPVLKKTTGKTGLDTVTQGLSAMRQTLSQVHLWQALSNEAELGDYLAILAGNSLIKTVLDESTLKLGQALAHVQMTVPYPGQGALHARLAWLASTLSNPALREQLQPHLEMLLGGKLQADKLLAVFQFADQIQRFPMNSSLSEQALWLFKTLDQGVGGTPVLQWVNHFKSALGADPATTMLLNRLLTLNQKPESLRLLIQDIATAIAPSVGKLAASHVAGKMLPTTVVRALETFYQESSATESWTGMCQRMANGAWAIAKPYLIAGVTGDPLAAATVQYAQAIQTHTSWEQTLRWFVAHDQSQDETLQFAYSQYLNAVLVWQVYQAFNSNEPVETEDNLRKLASQLKDYQVVKSYPQLEKLIDLIPLLPALREAQQEVQARVPTDSWLTWGQQWIDALANSNSHSLLELRDQLSRQVENWLADALMSTFDAMARQPWGLLPGAAATELKIQGAAQSEVTETDWARIDTQDMASPENAQPAAVPAVPGATGHGANWQLATGISLEAVGVAAIGYALWQTRHGDKDAHQQTELMEVLVQAPQDSQVDQTSLFQAPRVNATVATPLGNSSLMDQKVPLLLGVAAMAAGGAFLYYGANKDDWAQEALQISETEYEQEVEIIKALEVPDLDFIFDSPLAEAEPARVKRALSDIPIENNNIPGLIESIMTDETIDLNTRSELNCIYRRSQEAPDVKAATTQEHKNTRALLKTIQLTTAFRDEIDNKYYNKQTYDSSQTLLNKLWEIAENLTDEYSVSMVDRFNMGYLPEGGMVAFNMSDFEQTLLLPELVENFLRLGEKTLQQIETLYQPILTPASFIENYIRQGISDFEQQTGARTYMRPDSQVNVQFESQADKLVPGYGKSIKKIASFSLMDIVTGTYLYENTRLQNEHGKTFGAYLIEHKPLIKALKQENLQWVMEQALYNYRSEPTHIDGLKSYYKNMIELRCLAYLDQPHPIPLYYNAVKRFLAGELQAHEVEFHGVKLNGVFLIPAGSAGGVLLSVDEPNFYNVGSAPYKHQNKLEILPIFPHTRDFKDWAFSKMPTYEAQKYRATDSPFKCQIGPDTTSLGFIARSLGTTLKKPFSFVASQDQDDLARKLVDGLMNRLASDIDTMVFTSTEQVTEKSLEAAKTMLLVAGLALNVAIPGSGVVLHRIALFVTSLAMDAAYVGASAVQAHMSDRPEQADAFRDEAVLAGVLGGIFSGIGGVSLVKSMYSAKNVNQAISLYRLAKDQSRKAIPSLLSEMNWRRLADRKKVDLLVKTIQKSEQAHALANLTNRSAVEQSIRRNLTLDFEGKAKLRFAWGDFALERANVQRRLESDLTRLKNANKNTHWVLDQQPPVLRQSLTGPPKEAAADWIAGNSRSANTPEGTSRIKSVLEQYQTADLWDVSTLDGIHAALNKNGKGALEQTFRSSNDPSLMGSDIARAGFDKALREIEIKNIAGQVELSDVLYTAVVRYQPFVDGNGRTARTVYALARLQKGERHFLALSKKGEDLLNPPGPLGRTQAKEVPPQNYPLAPPPNALGKPNANSVSSLLGKESALYHDEAAKGTLHISAHGFPFNVNHLRTSELAAGIRTLVPNAGMSFVGTEGKTLVQRIELYSCYGAAFGRFSTGQVLADTLQVPVRAYKRKIGPASRDRGVVFKPETPESHSAVFNRRTNEILFNASEMVLAMRRIARPRRQAEPDAAANKMHAFLRDIVDAFEGKNNDDTGKRYREVPAPSWVNLQNAGINFAKKDNAQALPPGDFVFAVMSAVWQDISLKNRLLNWRSTPAP